MPSGSFSYADPVDHAGGFDAAVIALPYSAHGIDHARIGDDEILAAALEHAKAMRYAAPGDCVVALHRIGNASVIKVVDIK